MRATRTSGLRRWVLRAGLCLFLLPVLYLCANGIGALIPRETPKFTDSGAKIDVLLLAGPIHYDILLPLTAQTQEHLRFAQKAVPSPTHPKAQWVVLGWGSRAFYTTAGDYRDLRLATIWKAATGDSAVLRIDVAGPLPPDLEVQRLSLLPKAYRALLEALLEGVRPRTIFQASI